ncbi:MAG TPA: hypothetical protein VJN02_12220 [Gammaproteobacteria bacterium]|nr:hypothetical protein [Gammaproteobacteria bacterium]
MIDNRVAILDYHDSSDGQLNPWFEAVTGYSIACYVNVSDHVLDIDVEYQHSIRPTKHTEFPTKNSFRGKPLITSLNWIAEIKRLGIDKVVPVHPNNHIRLAQVAQCKAENIQLISAIHPSAILHDQAIIRNGVWINAGAIIGYKAEIKAGCIINNGAQIDHHCLVEQCCTVDPGAIIAGNVKLEKCVQLHTGVIVINRITIGESSIVGAGAVVIKDVPPNCTVVGNPARVIKHH